MAAMDAAQAQTLIDGVTAIGLRLTSLENNCNELTRQMANAFTRISEESAARSGLLNAQLTQIETESGNRVKGVNDQTIELKKYVDETRTSIDKWIIDNLQQQQDKWDAASNDVATRFNDIENK